MLMPIPNPLKDDVQPWFWPEIEDDEDYEEEEDLWDEEDDEE